MKTLNNAPPVIDAFSVNQTTNGPPQLLQHTRKLSRQRKKQIRNALLSAAKQRFQEQNESKFQHFQGRQHHESDSSNQNISFQIVAPISPSPHELISKVMTQLQLNTNSESLLLDFGVGDGRWIITAHQYTQCFCIGYDIDEERLELAKQNILAYSDSFHEAYCDDHADQNNQRNQNKLITDQIRVEKQDVFQLLQNLENKEVDDANIMIFYLFREAMKKISLLLKQRGFYADGDCCKHPNNDFPQSSIPISWNDAGDVFDHISDEGVISPRRINSDGLSLKTIQIVSVGFSLPNWSPPIWHEKCRGLHAYIYKAFHY